MTLDKCELFVSYVYGSEIGLIHTTRIEAENENETNNDSFEKSAIRICPSVFNKRPYKVLTLYDALDEVNEYVRSDERLNIYNNETSEY